MCSETIELRGRGRWREARGQQQRAVRGGKLAEKARGSLEPEKALFVLLGPLQNRKLTQKVTCDLFTPHLKFDSSVVSLSFAPILALGGTRFKKRIPKVTFSVKTAVTVTV